jgi:hypothetical protein
MLMTKDNKPLVIGAAGCLLFVLIIQFSFISANATTAQENIAAYEAKRDEWDKHFNGGANMLPKPKAVAKIEENRKQIEAGMVELQRIELGTKTGSLAQFTEAAAGGGDKRNYLETKRKQVLSKYSSRPKLNAGAQDLGLVDNATNDSVGTNLIRLFIADTILNACVKADVDTVNAFRAKPLSVIEYTDAEKAVLAPDEDEDRSPNRAKDKKGEKDKKDEAEAPSKLVQFPMEAVVTMPEKSVGKFLYELEKPSDGGRGYLAIRGFHVYVKDSKSGMVEVAVMASGLLTEKVVGELGIELKGKGGRSPSGRRGEIDLDSQVP